MRTRILISATIGATGGLFCWFFLDHFHLAAADFNWALWAARDLLAHRNPYAVPMQLYPLPTAFFGLPFLWLPPSVAAGAFFGISSGLMAFALTRDGYHRLLVFLAYPYWAALMTAQWTPLILASALLPLLLPATMIKPQIGLPVFLTRMTRRGVLACLVVLAASLVLMPSWPLLWVGNFHYYERFIPLLLLPGPLLVLALLRYKDRDALLLFLMAITPQRWFYDTLALWVIPKSRKQILATVLCSWGAGVWRWYHIPHNYVEVGRCSVIFLYLPMLAVVLIPWIKQRRSLPQPAKG